MFAKTKGDSSAQTRFSLVKSSEGGRHTAFLVPDGDPENGVPVKSRRAGTLWVDFLLQHRVIDEANAGELRAAVEQATHLPMTTPPVFQLFIGEDDKGPFANFQLGEEEGPRMLRKSEVRATLEMLFNHWLIDIEEQAVHMAAVAASRRLPEGEAFPAPSAEARMSLFVVFVPGQPYLQACLGHYHVVFKDESKSAPIDSRASGYAAVGNACLQNRLSDVQAAVFLMLIDVIYPASAAT